MICCLHKVMNLGHTQSEPLCTKSFKVILFNTSDTKVLIFSFLFVDIFIKCE